MTLDQTKDAVLTALAELEELNGLTDERYARFNPERKYGPWWTSLEIFAQIHGVLQAGRWPYWPSVKSKSPGRDRVVKAVNELRREGLVEYNIDSLGSNSEWRLVGARRTDA